MADTLFHIIPDSQVVVRSRGTYYQKKLYRRGDRLYAGWGGGFVRLGAVDATSNPNVSWEEIDSACVRMTTGKMPIYKAP